MHSLAKNMQLMSNPPVNMKQLGAETYRPCLAGLARPKFVWSTNTTAYC